jgi:hypothetical protein
MTVPVSLFREDESKPRMLSRMNPGMLAGWAREKFRESSLRMDRGRLCSATTRQFG